MSKSIVNWGVIGCAGIADTAVIPGIKGAVNAKLYAVSSRNDSKLNIFKEKHNPVKVYDSYEKMLDDPDIDAVYIPLPNGLHYEWTLKAAEKKKHVLCEKPLGISEKQVKEMKEVCDRNGVLLMEAFAYRHSPLTMKVKSLLDEGTIGKVRFIESQFCFLMEDLDNVRLSKDLNGGSVYDVGCYNISLIRYLMGEKPVSVHAFGDVGPESGVEENACIIMTFQNGTRAMSYSSFNTATWVGYRAVGESGLLEVPCQFNAKGDQKIIIEKKGSAEEIVVSCPDNYMLEVEQFGRCILEGEKPFVTYEDSIGNARVIDEALKQIITK
jgi:Predicted dehydrogenases and related proteins